MRRRRRQLGQPLNAPVVLEQIGLGGPQEGGGVRWGHGAAGRRMHRVLKEPGAAASVSVSEGQ